MKNDRWNIGDWVLCTNVEPMEEGKVIAHHPTGEFVTVKTVEGNEYFYPEASENLVLIEVEESNYHINPAEITDIDTFFLHLMASPSSISGYMIRDTAGRAMYLTNVVAKQSCCYFLSLAPISELAETWRKQALVLAGECKTLRPMMKGFSYLKGNKYFPESKSSDILN